MKQVFNPYLPAGEYIPDGEPHVFGNRVYVYGSHDTFGAPIFCVNDYVCWSAPVNDLISGLPTETGKRRLRALLPLSRDRSDRFYIISFFLKLMNYDRNMGNYDV